MMRTSSAVVTAVLASVATAFAAACSGESPRTSIPAGPDANARQHSLADLARSGLSPKAIALMRFGQAMPHAVKAVKNTGWNDLYVSNYFPENVVLLKNKTYKNLGTITKGLVSPDGDFVDASGNFYVSDYDGVDIQEYKPGAKSPSFTYNAGMVDPVNLTVDTQGNVYEADYDGYFVNEYAQKSNIVVNSCQLQGAAEGVAVDANNNVFVDFNDRTGHGRIAEYKGGLAGCKSTVFYVTLDFAGGMVLDAQDNLIVCDENAPAVDLIAPPYSSITGTLGSGFYLTPFHVSLSKNNKLAFVADTSDVFVVDYDYPSGSLADSLGSAYGWTFPAGAVDSENAVY